MKSGRGLGVVIAVLATARVAHAQEEEPLLAPPEAAFETVAERASRIEHRIEERLQRDRALRPFHIVALVSERNVVTLLGNVLDEKERVRAEALARLEPIRSIDNRIHLQYGENAWFDDEARWRYGAAPSDESLRNELRARLERELPEEAASVRLDAIDGSVILRGLVSTEEARGNLVGLVRKTKGLRQIVDELIVPSDV